MLLSPVSSSIAPPVPPKKHLSAATSGQFKGSSQTEKETQTLTNRTCSQIVKITTPPKTDSSIMNGIKEKVAALINNYQKTSVAIGAAGGIGALSLLAYKCFERAAQAYLGHSGPSQASYSIICGKELATHYRSGESSSFQEGVLQIFSQAQTQDSVLCANNDDNQWIELIPCQEENNTFIPCEPSENLICPSLCAFDKTGQKLFEPDWETLSKPHTCSRNPTSTTLEFLGDLSPNQMKSLQCDQKFVPAWCIDQEYFCVKNNDRWQPIYDCTETWDTFFEECDPSSNSDCTSLCTKNMEGHLFPITWTPSKCIEQFNKTGTFLRKIKDLSKSDLSTLRCNDPEFIKAWCPNE